MNIANNAPVMGEGTKRVKARFYTQKMDTLALSTSFPKEIAVTEKKRRMTAKQMTRGFQKLVGTPAPMYRGKRAGPAEIVREARARAPELASRLTGMELKFLTRYYELGTLAAAYRSLRPGLSDRSCYQRGAVVMKTIRGKLSDQELFELAGLSVGAITTAVTGALNATTQKDFVLPRTGQIISTEPVADHQTRLQAASLGVKLRRMAVDDEKGQQVTINVVQYNPPGTPPWPGAVWPRGFPAGSLPPGITTINPINSNSGGRQED
jgi:hypothetical protein